MRASIMSLIAGLLLITSPASAQDEIPSAADAIDPAFNGLWAEKAEVFLGDGVSREEARQAFAWSLLQGQLGRCYAVTKTDDVAFWRGWFKDQRAFDLPSLRYIMRFGDRAFVTAKAAAAKKKKPDELNCSVTIAALIVEMKK